MVSSAFSLFDIKKLVLAEQGLAVALPSGKSPVGFWTRLSDLGHQVGIEERAGLCQLVRGQRSAEGEFVGALQALLVGRLVV